MLTAEEVIKNVCDDYAGINVQTVMIDPKRPQDEPVTVFSYDETAKISIVSAGSGIVVKVWLEDEQEYSGLCNAVTTMEQLEPSDDKILENIMTIIPKEPEDEDGMFYYLSGYISTVTSRESSKMVLFSFLQTDFQVFCTNKDEGE